MEVDRGNKPEIGESGAELTAKRKTVAFTKPLMLMKRILKLLDVWIRVF
jgi:hypothetical protein